jgi:membrane-associated phospholipid phosphatase
MAVITSRQLSPTLNMLTSLTNLADLAVVLPLAIAILLWLLVMRSTMAAAWWLIAVAICIGGTALLKIYFFACPPMTDLQSPSGHSSLGTLVYGTLFMFIAVETRRWQRWVVTSIGALFILSIAVSRQLLHTHSALEVWLGLLVGSVTLAIFTKSYLSHHPMRVWLQPLVVAVVILLIIFHGHELRAEEVLDKISAYLDIAKRLCSSNISIATVA